MKTNPMIEKALRLHKAGDLVGAVRDYRKILERDPRHAEAMHLLGLAIGQQGDQAKALEWIDKALAREPANAVMHKNRGSTLARLGRLEAAAEAHARALLLQPDFLDARIALGGVQADLGRFAESLATLDEALRRHPSSAQAQFQRGRALQLAGRLPEAVEAYSRAIALDAGHAQAHNNLGVIYDRAGEDGRAVECFEQAVRLQPGYVHGLRNLAAVLLRLKRFADAVPRLRQMLKLDPDNADGWNKLGLALHELQAFDEVEACYLRAAELDPANCDALVNLGNLRLDLERDEEAGAFYRRALAVDGRNVEALNGLRSTLVKSGRDEEAIAVTERLLAIKPDHAIARFHLSWMMLGHGLFEDGFREYAWRPSRRDPAGPPGGMPWAESLPEDMHGLRVLLCKDQGIGDEIFFLRFVPWLKRRGAWIRYLATPKIASLVARSGVADEVVTEWRADPGLHLAINVGDLPHLLGLREAAQLPPSIPLTPLPEQRARARRLLAEFGPPPYIAVTWRAGRDKLKYIGRLVRSLSKTLTLETLAGFLPGAGTVVSLQRQPNAGEVEKLAGILGRPVLDLDALNEDLEGMLGVLAEVDAYYTVSNANVHLMAGLGRAATVFVPFPPEWRWMVAGGESPWFPGCRLIRQSGDRSWPSPP